MESTSTASRGGKYITFNLGQERYGIPIGRVRSIVGIAGIRKTSSSQVSVRGVINLRGRDVSVIDLRMKLSVPPAHKAPDACVIVVETKQGTQTISTGLVVDNVGEVPHLREDAIDDAPASGMPVEKQVLFGSAITGAGTTLLLDVNKLIGTMDHSIPRAA